MEQYKKDIIGNLPTVNFGKYSSLIYNKHKEKYDIVDAENIRDSMLDFFVMAQNQVADQTKNNNLLLVGQVQSGKTSNIEMGIAYAFDNGYNLVVIYGGYDTSLLQQTKKRMINAFESFDISFDTDKPIVLSTDDGTILGLNENTVEDFLDFEKPIILISMKRPQAMKKINDVLKKIKDNPKIKGFIIDDEGDQASLNTERRDKKNNSSPTYREIQIMKRLLNDPMYWSVTATPQANIFQPWFSDLRPETIKCLSSGVGYTGIERFHLTENDVIEIINDNDDVGEIINIPDSLKESIFYYILASSAMRKNDKRTTTEMIIHSCREIKEQKKIYSLIFNFITIINQAFERKDRSLDVYLNELRNSYNKYFSLTIQEMYPFEELIPDIIVVVKKIDIVLKNSDGKETQVCEDLKWFKIYIGGDLLQRGLTFPHLITTYFTRWTKLKGNMDTTLQRARWFGYRENYFDFCKIFTTEEIAQELRNLAEIDYNLRSQFKDVENGKLTISDILINAESTNLLPTNKRRVSYDKVIFKQQKWSQQNYILLNEPEKINENNKKVDLFIKGHQWILSSVGSPTDKPTCLYSNICPSDIEELLPLIVNQMEYKVAKSLSNLIKTTVEPIPVILMQTTVEDATPRIRSLFENTNKIKQLFQGVDTSNLAKQTYQGDRHVIIDRNKINIQIHKVTPKYKDKILREADTQYMFAVYIPCQSEYYVGREDHA